MNEVNYTKEGVNVKTEKDGIIVRKHIAGLAGGRALDMTGYSAKVVPCGLPIITDGNGNYKPLVPTDDAANGGFVVPAGYKYAGICGATVLAGKAVSVVVAGIINWVAMLAHIKEVLPTPNRVLTKDDLTAIAAALPHIIFECDEAGDMTVSTISNVVLIDSQEDFTANFSMLADYYAKNPNAAGHDGNYPNDPWVVANFSGLEGTMVVSYDGVVKAELPGVTKESTYVIISVAGDLNMELSAFDLTKLSLTVVK